MKWWVESIEKSQFLQGNRTRNCQTFSSHLHPPWSLPNLQQLKVVSIPRTDPTAECEWQQLKVASIPSTDPTAEWVARGWMQSCWPHKLVYFFSISTHRIHQSQLASNLHSGYWVLKIVVGHLLGYFLNQTISNIVTKSAMINLSVWLERTLVPAHHQLSLRYIH